jgi:hypothetical protein
MLIFPYRYITALTPILTSPVASAAVTFVVVMVLLFVIISVRALMLILMLPLKFALLSPTEERGIGRRRL